MFNVNSSCIKEGKLHPSPKLENPNGVVRIYYGQKTAIYDWPAIENIDLHLQTNEIYK